MTLIVDTGVIVAATKSKDPSHEGCRSLLADGNAPIPAPVLVEVDHHLGSGPTWMALLHDIAQGSLRVVDLELIGYERIHELMTTYADLRVGFVDCAVLAVVERLDEPKLAILDRRHFSVMRPAHVDSLRLLP
ncbi:MAG: type II toxin-antitoxin system VapC family toxin [Egibacteraceae bacterium]